MSSSARPAVRDRRRRRRGFAVGAAAVVCVGALGVVGVSQSADAAGASANVWLTTPDRANLLAAKPAVDFGSGGGGTTITVDPGRTYQSMVGFGASITDSSASLLAGSSQRNAVMTKLFDPANGIGLSWLRQPIGASDFARSFYTYDDGSADPSLSRFSVAHDEQAVLPLVRQARSLNPAVTVMGTPWSAPAWMKTNGNLVGGSLSTSSEDVYAAYLAKFVEAYAAAGVPVQYLSVQNEPQFSPPGYPGMLMSSDQQTAVVNRLAAKLSAAGRSTKILAWDHNWDNTSYPLAVLSGSAGSRVAGVAWHCYGGTPEGQTTVHNAQPGKDTFFTECSGTESSNPANTFADTLKWQGSNLAVGAVRNWSRTVSLWNLALDAEHGPVIGSCDNCMGVVTVDGSTITYNAEYYVLGHLSKFVKPGAVRIDSTSVASGGVQSVAFRNPDGSVVLVGVNTGGTQNVQVSYQGASFGYSVPAGAMVTFTWPGSVSGNGGNGGNGAVAVKGPGGKCMDVADASTTNGAAVQLYTCNGSAAQQWTFGADGTVRALGKCLDAVDRATGNGTKLQVWDCTGGTNQQWSRDGAALKGVASGRCLDDTDGSTADRNRLQLWDCTGGPNQQWTFA